MIRIRHVATFLLPALAACGGGEDEAARAPQPTVVLTDSVELEENDSTFIGAAAYMVADRSGSVYVSDAMNGHVLQFDAEGRLVRRFGRSGSGPGELGSPLASALIGDSLLALADWRENRTSLFSRSTGAFVRSVRHEGLPFTMEAGTDTVWMASVNMNRLTSLARWSLAEDSMVYFGPLPQEYRDSRPLLVSHPYASAVLLGPDSLLVGYTGHPQLFVTDREGAVIDTVEIPTLRRRGVPKDMVARFAKLPEHEEIAAMSSSLIALHRLPSGEVAAFHLDVDFREGLITAAGYLSVLSADLSRACVDHEIPFVRDGRPVVAFSGDRLFALEPRVTGAAEAATVLRTYRIDTAGCDWVPVPA